LFGKLFRDLWQLLAIQFGTTKIPSYQKSFIATFLVDIPFQKKFRGILAFLLSHINTFLTKKSLQGKKLQLSSPIIKIFTFANDKKKFFSPVTNREFGLL